MDLAALIDIEHIKQLKARYFRLLDTKQYSEFPDVFTEDCRVRFGEGEDDRWIVGRERIVRVLQRVTENGMTVHQGYMPEIEVTGEGTATGVWAMEDYVETFDEPPIRLRGYGHYHERYAKEADGRWRIAELQLTRLRVDDL